MNMISFTTRTKLETLNNNYSHSRHYKYIHGMRSRLKHLKIKTTERGNGKMSIVFISNMHTKLIHFSIRPHAVASDNYRKIPLCIIQHPTFFKLTKTASGLWVPGNNVFLYKHMLNKNSVHIWIIYTAFLSKTTGKKITKWPQFHSTLSFLRIYLLRNVNHFVKYFSEIKGALLNVDGGACSKVISSEVKLSQSSYCPAHDETRWYFLLNCFTQIPSSNVLFHSNSDSLCIPSSVWALAVF